MRGLTYLTAMLSTAVSLSAAAADEVRLFSWEAYFSADSITEFERETGHKVTYDVFDSNDMVETRILAGDSGYDVVTPNLVPHLARQLPLGIWAELDMAKLPNAVNIDPGLMATLAKVDPGNRHAMPWMWGTTGIGYNVDMVKARMPDAPVDSWSMIFDPAIAAKFADCGIAMLDDSEQVLGSALIYLGLDPDTENPADLEKAVAVIAAVRPYVRQFHGSSYVAGLAAGDLCVALGYSGDMLVATNRAKEAGKAYAIEYRLPKEGNLVWFDTLTIPADAPNPDAAHAFINFFLRPEIAAKSANETGFSTANAAALPLVDPAIRSNPNYYPGAEERTKFHLPNVKSDDVVKMWDRAWNRAKGIE